MYLIGRCRWCRVLFWLLLVLAQQTALAAAPAMENPEWLADPRGEMSLEAVRNAPENAWQPLADARLSPGFSEAVYWVRMSLTNPDAVEQERILELTQPLLDYVDVHVLSDGGPLTVWQTGGRRPAVARPIVDRDFAFPVRIPALATVAVYVRLESHDGLFDPVSFRLLEREQYQALRLRDAIGHGVYYGAIGILFVYTLLVGAIARERALVTYSAYLFAFLTWHLASNGHVALWFLRDHPHWANQLVPLAAIAATALVLHLGQQFLDLRHVAPRMAQVLNRGMQLLLVPAMLALVGRYALVYQLFIPLSTMLLLLILGVALRLALRRDQAARMFVMAWVFAVVAVLVYQLALWGVLPAGWARLSLINAGVLVQIFLLALALLYRINELRNARLVEQELLVERERKLTTELQQRVAERTAELTRMARRLEQESIVDPLTGLLNRRTFDRGLEDALQRLPRSGRPLYLVMIDLDGFSEFNASAGRRQGDRLLQGLGAVLLEQWQRAGDSCFRMGGDEFGLIFSEPGGDAVMTQRLRDLQQAMAAGELPVTAAFDGRVTLSIGVARATPDAPAGSEAVYAAADRALQRSKRAGGNCISIEVAS